jgi:hypothetical protein
MIESILRSHLTRYPAMQIQDVYKLIHQAALGSEHAAPDPESARKWIEREIAEMGDGPSEPVVDPISPDGEIVRVHLRPYASRGGSLERLVEAFIRTANEHRGEIALLESYWTAAVRLGIFSAAEMDGFIQPLKAENYPAVHHSAAYRNAYHPSYRVVSQKVASWLNEPGHVSSSNK